MAAAVAVHRPRASFQPILREAVPWPVDLRREPTAYVSPALTARSWPKVASMAPVQTTVAGWLASAAGAIRRAVPRESSRCHVHHEAGRFSFPVLAKSALASRLSVGAAAARRSLAVAAGVRALARAATAPGKRSVQAGVGSGVASGVASGVVGHQRPFSP